MIALTRRTARSASETRRGSFSRPFRLWRWWSSTVCSPSGAPSFCAQRREQPLDLAPPLEASAASKGMPGPVREQLAEDVAAIAVARDRGEGLREPRKRKIALAAQPREPPMCWLRSSEASRIRLPSLPV